MPFQLTAGGLNTSRNELLKREGSLETADNVNIDDNNLIEPRRGFEEFGTALSSDSDRLSQLLAYKDRVIRHVNSELQYAGGTASDTAASTFTAFNGSYSQNTETVLNQSVDVKIKGLEAKSNFYFSTNTGIKKISATTGSEFVSTSGYIRNAGVAKALGPKVTLSPATGGFLPGQSKCAYRVVWGYKDKNNNVILGSPSERVIVQNNSEDQNSSEVFTITVTGALTDNQFVNFTDGTTNYTVYWHGTPSTALTQTADTVGRTQFQVVDVGSVNTDAALIAQAIESNCPNVTATASSGTVTVTLPASAGSVTDATAPNGTTNFSISVIQQGRAISDQSANTSLTFTIPSEITALTYTGIAENYFYQIYRTEYITVGTGQTLDDIDPGDEMQLVEEATITSSQHTAGVVTTADITPESLRDGGVYLYTNPTSGEGILQSNDQPPIAKDIALFKDSVFFANTKTRHKKTLNLLSVDNITNNSSKFIIGNNQVAREYIFSGAAQIQRIDTVAEGAGGFGNGDYFLINSAENERKYYVWFDVSSATDPAVADRIGLYVKIASGDTNAQVATKLAAVINATEDFSASVAGGNQVTITWLKKGKADDASDGASATGFTFNTPSTQGYGEGTNSGSVSSATAANPMVVTTSANHSLTVGEWVNVVQGTQSIYKQITAVTSNTFTLDYNNGGGATGSGTFWQNTVLLQDGSNLSTSQNIDETARSLVRIINSDTLSPVYAYYLSGPDDLPGIIQFEARAIEDRIFYFGTNDSSITGEFSPELSSTSSITGFVAATDVITTGSAHGFSVGDEVYVYSTPYSTYTLGGSLGKYFVKTVPLSTTFTLSSTSGGTTLDLTGSSATGLVFKADVYSENLENKNRLYFSKVSQPESVPSTNYVDVGPKDQPIIRIAALRDNLMILKTDGIYILSGAVSPFWSVRLLDSSTKVYAGETMSLINNQIYCLSSQGVVRITESGIEIISGNIEDLILDFMNDDFNYADLSFGVGYETERAYHLWVPEDSTDTVATQCYRYNIFTNAWTRWDKAATCGMINPADDKMYIGSGTRKYMEKERKNRNRKDHSDRDFAITFNPNFKTGFTVLPASSSGISIGDAIVQTQTVTIHRVNQLLRRLDVDDSRGGISSPTLGWYDTYQVADGANLLQELAEINAELVSQDISSVITDHSFASASSFTDLATKYDALIAQLNNASSDTFFKDYDTLGSSTTEYEALIIGKNITTGVLTVAQDVPFISGAASVFKKYDCTVIWQPQHFGDPVKEKQITDAQVMFDQTNFYEATIEFSTDISPEYEGISILGDGRGDFGDSDFGENYFGGQGSEAPFRTYVPREKSRCRFIRTKFKHSNAREDWAITGITYSVRGTTSERAYK